MEYSSDRTMMTSNTNHSPPHPRLRPQFVSPSLPWSSPFGIRASASTSTSPFASPGRFSNDFPDRSPGASSETATAKAHPKRSRHVILPPFPSTHSGGDQSRGEGMDCSDSDDNCYHDYDCNYDCNYENTDYGRDPFFPSSKRRRLWTQAVQESVGALQSNPPSQEPPNFVPWEDHHCRSEARGPLSSASGTATTTRNGNNGGSGSDSSNITNPAVPWWKKQKPKPSHRRIVEPEDEPMDGSHGTNNDGESARVACHVCCASFVPPPPPTIRSVMPENALLHYFSVQPSKPTPTPTQRCTGAFRPGTAVPRSPSRSAAADCPCCDRPTCPDCRNQCGVCSREFCSFCCTFRYPGTTVCPDCC